ncbi:hypothetical protein DCS_05051 [Drechmeria coniospora]|uniref:Uncharacterized protein n=1 Tax=Drechmeria coniospora TaxID=98403 RepID=A0A151GLS4_DRECN|nr:hypothetical protein DCS_05051 [Drechmeria coniospora]KYK58038.1 hypothetical protein DCS_05051 [Drechmeria coniospora]
MSLASCLFTIPKYTTPNADCKPFFFFFVPRSLHELRHVADNGRGPGVWNVGHFTLGIVRRQQKTKAQNGAHGRAIAEGKATDMIGRIMGVDEPACAGIDGSMLKYNKHESGADNLADALTCNPRDAGARGKNIQPMGGGYLYDEALGG